MADEPGAYSKIPDPADAVTATACDGPPMPEPWEIAWANGAEVECCASGRCEVCAPGGFGGSRHW